MRHLSVFPVPNLGKTTRSPQSDLTPWILTLGEPFFWFFGFYSFSREYLYIVSLDFFLSTEAILSWHIQLSLSGWTYVLNHEIEKCQFMTSKANFLCQKLSESFHFFFIDEYHFRGMFFIIEIFWKLQFFQAVYILKSCQLNSKFW